MILLVALAAPGVSYLSNVDVAGRGYEDLIERLQSIHARVDVSGVRADKQMPEGAIRSVM